MARISQVLGDPVAKTGVWRLLDNPFLWESRRIALDFLFKFYPNRIAVLREWGLVGQDLSVLDIGCGTGQYAGITNGNYLGVDLTERYIEYARRRIQRPNQSFRCADALSLLEENRSFDVVLMIDFLHHISDEGCIQLLRCASRLGRHVVVFDQVSEQPNPIARWIVEHDRGAYVRSLERLYTLIRESGMTVAQSRVVMLGPIVTRCILTQSVSGGPPNT